MKETKSTESVPDSDSTTEAQEDNVTPLRCFGSSIVAGGLAYVVYLLFNSIVQTYATKTITGTNPLVINITAAVRTLVMGTMAMATGVFGLVAVGLFLLGIQLTIQSIKKA